MNSLNHRRLRCSLLTVVLLSIRIAGAEQSAPCVPSSFNRYPVSLDTVDRLFKEMRQPYVNRLALGKQLAGLGKEVVPRIREALRGENDPLVTRGALYAAGEIGPLAPELLPDIAKFLNSKDRDIRLNAVAAVGKFGPLARSSISQCAYLLRDADGGVQTAAREAFVRIGLTALPELEREKRRQEGWFFFLFGSSSLASWQGSLDDLRLMKPGFSIADQNRQYGRPGASVSELVSRLSSTNGFDKDFALKDLARIGPEGMAALPQLIEILRADPSPGYRRLAAEALGSHGPDAQEAIAHLKEALSDCDANVRLASAWALGSIGPKAIPSVRTALQSTKTHSQLAAVRTLEFIYTPEAWEALHGYWRSRNDGFYPYDEEKIKRILGR